MRLLGGREPAGACLDPRPLHPRLSPARPDRAVGPPRLGRGVHRLIECRPQSLTRITTAEAALTAPRSQDGSDLRESLGQCREKHAISYTVCYEVSTDIGELP